MLAQSTPIFLLAKFCFVTAVSQRGSYDVLCEEVENLFDREILDFFVYPPDPIELEEDEVSF